MNSSLRNYEFSCSYIFLPHTFFLLKINHVTP